MEIEFDTKILACDKHRELLTKDYDTIVLFGGRGAGKTLDIAKILVKECLSEVYFNCVVVFANSNKIKEGVYSDIKRFIIDYGLGELFTFTTSPLRIECVNGNKFIFRGGQEMENAKGISEPNRIWFEEANNIEEEAHDVFLTSLRSQKGNVKRYYSFNPEAKHIKYTDHWIYRRFFKDNVDNGINIYDSVVREINNLNTITIHSTLDDNPYCPESLKNDINSYEIINPTKYKIWRLGKFSAIDNINQYAQMFSHSRNVKKVEIRKDYPIHVSLDQNFLPYSTAVIFQTYLEDGKVLINAIDEICLTPPNNSTEHVCEAILAKYKDFRIYLYGDYSGNARTQKIEKSNFKNHYDLAKKKLRFNLAQNGFKVYPNPKRAVRRDIINTILQGEGTYIMNIDPKCVNLINDFEQMSTDVNGINYIKVKNKEGHEIVGHCFDCTIYFLHGCYPNLFKR